VYSKYNIQIDKNLFDLHDNFLFNRRLFKMKKKNGEVRNIVDIMIKKMIKMIKQANSKKKEKIQFLKKHIIFRAR
jgi:hypothetical protein